MNRHIDELRRIVAETALPPAGMEAYLAQVRERAYEISDADVEGLKGSGFSEDEIFEQTVAAAIDEGLRRLDAARQVLG